MDGADDFHVLVVDRVPIKIFLVEFENMTHVVIGLVDVRVLDFRLTLGAFFFARKILNVL